MCDLILIKTYRRDEEFSPLSQSGVDDTVIRAILHVFYRAGLYNEYTAQGFRVELSKSALSFS